MAGRHVPELCGAICPPRQQLGTVRAEHLADACANGSGWPYGPAGCDVPESHDALVAVSHGLPAGRRKGDKRNFGVVLQRLSSHTVSLNVAEPGEEGTPDKDGLAVWADRQRVYVTWQLDPGVLQHAG